MKLSEELTWRGFVNQTTFKDITEIDKKPLTFYWGVDPSAPSMQVGNFAMAMMVRHFIRHGHKPILLVGGATGLIGDPDGKDIERELMSPDEVAKNKAAIAAQYKKIFAGEKFQIVDNYDWFKEIGYMEFLRNIGKHVPMRQMLGREFVQNRLSQDGAGISYAEFSYSLIQGYDFLHLFREKGVTLQVAGSDQWGNSIAGVELIRRITGKEAHVWTGPLVLNKVTGKKFGKTEEGTLWLDENMTSVYKFYQFWLNVDDEGVVDYLKMFTTLSKQKIEDVIHDFNKDKAKRLAQKTLAYEVTKIVHGDQKADDVKGVTEVLFGEDEFSALSANQQKLLADELGGVVKYTADIPQLLVNASLASSKSEARTFLSSGAISINGVKASAETHTIRDGLNLFKRGKNNFAVIKK